MYVTFLYELDRSTWSKQWQRNFANYIEKFKDLLSTLKHAKQTLVVFAADERVEQACLGYANVTYVKKELEAFYWWRMRKTVGKVLLRRYMRYNIPEYFSAEYVCLQLCKFEALLEGAKLAGVDNTGYRWIDAGVRGTAQYQWNKPWKKNGVHICCTAPPLLSEWLVTEAPVQTVVGGCFGCKTVQDVQWLNDAVTTLEHELLMQNKHANDQVILSILLHRHPSKFVVNRCYTQYVAWQILGMHVNWDRALLALHEEEDDFQDYRIHTFMGLFVLLLLLYSLLSK